MWKDVKRNDFERESHGAYGKSWKVEKAWEKQMETAFELHPFTARWRPHIAFALRTPRHRPHDPQSVSSVVRRPVTISHEWHESILDPLMKHEKHLKNMNKFWIRSMIEYDWWAGRVSDVVQTSETTKMWTLALYSCTSHSPTHVLRDSLLQDLQQSKFFM